MKDIVKLNILKGRAARVFFNDRRHYKLVAFAFRQPFAVPTPCIGVVHDAKLSVFG